MNIAFWDFSEGATGPMMLGALMGTGLDQTAWRSAMDRLPWSDWRVDIDADGDAGRRTHVRIHGSPRTLRLEDLGGRTMEALPKPAAATLANTLELLRGATPDLVLMLPEAVALAGVHVGAALLSLDRHWRTPLSFNPKGIAEAAGVLAGSEVVIRTDRPVQVSLVGAALACSLATVASHPVRLRLRGVGVGIGHPGDDVKETDRVASCVTVSIATALDELPLEHAFEICATVDDMDPELIPPVVSSLRESGALDAWWSPAVTRGGRPGVTIHALSSAADVASVCHALLHETTTIGVRFHEVLRHVLPRSHRTVSTEVGEVAIKETVLPDGMIRWKAELGDCLQAARAKGLTVEEVRAMVRRAMEGRSRS